VASIELVNVFFEFVVFEAKLVDLEVEAVDVEAILFLDLGKVFFFAAPLFVEDFALTVLLLEEMRPVVVVEPGTLLFEFALREDELVVLEISVVLRRDVVELDEVELLFVRVEERLAVDVGRNFEVITLELGFASLEGKREAELALDFSFVGSPGAPSAGDISVSST